MIRRREFIAGLGSAVAWPVVVRAQQSAMPVIGVLSPFSADDGAGPGRSNFTAAFLQSLKENGFVEGRNVAIEYHWAEGQPDRLPGRVTDLTGFPHTDSRLPRSGLRHSRLPLGPGETEW